MVEVSALQDQTVISVGGRGMGAVVVNRQFFFGGYGQSGHTIVLLSDTHPYQATLSQGGFVLGYIHKASRPVHLLTNARLGWASITVKEVSTQQSFEQNNFTITPSIGAEMNVTRLLRVQLMGGYRMSINAGLTQPGKLMPIDMNSLVGTLTLSFGLF